MSTIYDDIKRKGPGSVWKATPTWKAKLVMDSIAFLR